MNFDTLPLIKKVIIYDTLTSAILLWKAIYPLNKQAISTTKVDINRGWILCTNRALQIIVQTKGRASPAVSPILHIYFQVSISLIFLTYARLWDEYERKPSLDSERYYCYYYGLLCAVSRTSLHLQMMCVGSACRTGGGLVKRSQAELPNSICYSATYIHQTVYPDNLSFMP